MLGGIGGFGHPDIAGLASRSLVGLPEDALSPRQIAWLDARREKL